jgi:hypothetical protein
MGTAGLQVTSHTGIRFLYGYQGSNYQAVVMVPTETFQEQPTLARDNTSLRLMML